MFHSWKDCVAKFKKHSEKTRQIKLNKGQIISKGLFDAFEFSQITNERICRGSKNEFVRSFLWIPKVLSKLSDLYDQKKLPVIARRAKYYIMTFKGFFDRF